MTSVHPIEQNEENDDATDIVVTAQTITSQPHGVASRGSSINQSTEADPADQPTTTQPTSVASRGSSINQAAVAASSDQPTTTQPTKSQSPEGQNLPTEAMRMPRPQPIPGVPPGLECLAKLDQLMVQQEGDIDEVCSVWNDENTYMINNMQGEQLFLVTEESVFCMRWFFGAKRGFVLHITDKSGEEVIRVTREFKYCAGCFLCANSGRCANELIVESPVGTICGYVRMTKSWYSLQDANRQDLLYVRGPPIMWLGLCFTADKEFRVLTPDWSREVGLLARQWSGCCKEWLSGASRYKVNFPVDMDVRLKVLVFVTTFFIDFTYFQG